MAKKRAVAYVRVSSGSDAQLHSFDFQAEYWTTTLAEQPDVELVGIYADKGISGRSAEKRPQFQMMMQDARAGQFDVIYTKSTSRFARNTVDLLNAVRELRDLGVEVVFQNENISTLQPTSEVYLTIAAALAENELQEDSARQRWSYQDRFKNGWISIGKRMYGYKMTEGNQVEIIEEEAEIVRRIFDLYIAGNGAVQICKILNGEGLKNSYGNPWDHNNILEIISNEKYTGNALMGKHVRINGVHMRNPQGQYSQRYYIENTHEAIISQAIARGDTSEVNRLARQVSLHQLLVACMIFFFIWINLSPLFAIIPNGEQYTSGMTVVLFLGIANILNSTLSISTSILNFSKHYMWSLLFISLLTAAAIGLNLWLIPLMGVAGPACATLLAYIIYYVPLLLLLWHRLRISPFSSKQAHIILLTLLLFALNALWQWGLSPLFARWGTGLPVVLTQALARTLCLAILSLAIIRRMHISPEVDRITHFEFRS